MEWKSLGKALEEAKTSKKPVLLLFTTSGFGGAATLNTTAMRAALKSCGAIPARVLPPQPPQFARGMTREEYRLATEEYAKAQKQYVATARKYGATVNPTLVGLAPGGELVSRAYGPTEAQVISSLKRLPALVEASEKKKACPPGDKDNGQKDPGSNGQEKPPPPTTTAPADETRLGRLVLASIKRHAGVRTIRDAHPARFGRFMGLLDAVKVEVDWKPATKPGGKPEVKLTGALKGKLPAKKMNIRRDVAYEITGWEVTHVAEGGKCATVVASIKLGDYPLSGRMTIGAAKLAFDVGRGEK